MNPSLFEIRLCSLALGEWLDGRGKGEHVELPSGLGSMFDGVVRRAQGGETSITPVALRGVRFESVDFAVSVVHAMAVAAVATGGNADTADDVERFLRGEGAYRVGPDSLRSVGVYSVMPKSRALEVSKWALAIDPSVYEREVRSMYGAASKSYLAAARDLGGVFGSVALHGADICCWSSH